MALAWSCTVSEAKQRCTQREYRQWMAYYEIEPFGEERADLRMAILASVVASVAGSNGATPSDFMPKFEPAKPQTPEQLMSKFKQYADLHNASNRKR